ncbi:MAG: hypothetical protein JST92_10050, partial [Deltaproteobacteria bacterium]|nr:hypothetical protein [Deltaproteobacteria bacterium]
QSLADLFGSLTPLRALVAASRLALELEGREALTDGGAEDGYTARLQISGERVTGALALTWSDGRTNIDRDEEIACEVLCDHLATELDRLTPPAAAKPTT